MIKIKEQIAQDRAERSDKFNKEKLEREEKRKDQEMQKLAEEAKKAETKQLLSFDDEEDIYWTYYIRPMYSMRNENMN